MRVFRGWCGAFLLLILVGVCCLVSETQTVIVGIDFGSDSFKVVMVKSRSAEVVLNRGSERKTANAFAYSPNGRVFEASAIQMMARDPEIVYHHIGEIIGRRADDVNVAWLSDLKREYHMYWLSNAELVDRRDNTNNNDELKERNGEKGNPGMIGDRVGDRLQLHEELVAQIMSRIKEYVESEVKTAAIDCVIAVPVHWTFPQREAILNAANLAGLSVMSLVNQDSALAIKYCIDRDIAKNKSHHVMFYDLGESSLRVTLYRIVLSARKSGAKEGVPEVNLVVRTSDTGLGGMQFDNRIVELLMKRLEGKVSEEALASPVVKTKLWLQARKVKEMLSVNREARVTIDNLTPTYDFGTVVTRLAFEEAAGDLFDRALEPVRRVLKDAGMGLDQIDAFELFGASTRIPKLQENLARLLAPVVPGRRLNADEAAAYGAALYGAMLSSQHRMREYDLTQASVTSQSVHLDVSAAQGGETWNLSLSEVGDVEALYRGFVDAIETHTCAKVLPELKNATRALSGSEYWHFRGLCEYDMEKYHDALASFQRVIDIEADHVMAWNNLGVVLDNLGRFEEAVKAFDSALVHQPNFLKSWYNKAVSLIHIGNSQSVSSLLGQIMALNSSSAMPWYIQAHTNMAANQLDLSLTDLDRALALQPDHLASKVSRCHVLKQKGQDVSAPECAQLLDQQPTDVIEKMLAINDVPVKKNLSNSDAHETLFTQGTFFGTQTTRTFQTTRDLIVRLSHVPVLPGLPRDLGSYHISWPSLGTLLNRSQYMLTNSLIRLTFGVNKNGTVSLSNIGLAVSYVEVTEDGSVGSHGVATVEPNVTVLTYLGLTPSQIETCRRHLDTLDAEERTTRETERIRSDLESLSYKVYELLDDAEFKQFSTEDERQMLSANASDCISWLDLHGTDAASATALKSDLSSRIDRIDLRIKESTQFPKAINECGVKLGIARIRLNNITSMHNLTDDDIFDAQSLLNSTLSFVKSADVAHRQKPIASDGTTTSSELKSKCDYFVSYVDRLSKRPKKPVEIEKPASVEPPPDEFHDVASDSSSKDEL